jgi:hypothetical protein
METGTSIVRDGVIHPYVQIVQHNFVKEICAAQCKLRMDATPSCIHHQHIQLLPNATISTPTTVPHQVI